MPTSTVGLIAGCVFLILMGIRWFIQRSDARKKKYEEAKNDAKKAVAAHDTAALLDAQRRMSNYK